MIFYYYRKIIIKQQHIDHSHKYLFKFFKQMSQKPKRQFLKKGTRQFLSNAQVRSQINKPKIVDFGSEEVNQYEEIKIAPQKILKQEPRKPPKPSPIQSMKKKESIKEQKPYEVPQRIQQLKKVSQNNDQIQFQLKNKKNIIAEPKQEKSISKKVSNNQDEDNNMILYLNKKKKPDDRKSVQRKQQKKQEKTPVYKRQQFVEESKQLKKKTSYPQKQQYPQKPSYPQKPQQRISIQQKIVPEKPPLDRRQFNNKKYKESSSDDSLQKEQKNQLEYNFNDNEDWERSQLKKEIQVSKNRLLQEIEQEKFKDNTNIFSGETFAPKSKLVEKYFDNNNQKKNSLNNQQKAPVLRIEDIPEDLKSKIVEEGMQHAKQKLQIELQKIKMEANNTRKIKSQYQQLVKQVQRQKKQLQKQFEIKKNEFQQYMKEQKLKIMKDKKVIKDSLDNKYTNRKDKQQIQDLKNQLEALKEDKKKTEQKLKMQNERIKKRLEEQTQKNKQLQEQIQILELTRIKQKQQKQQQQKKQNQNYANTIPKPTTQIHIPVISQQSAQPKTDAIIQKMKQQNFTLMSLSKQQYKYDSNQHFKYYLKRKNDDLELQSEKIQEERVKRAYTNGKVQIQYYNKFLKQIYNNFSVVHHSNGDIKQSLPEGIVIYFDYTTQIVQFTITPNKKIHYFYNQDQVQMTFETDYGSIHETYDGINLKRKLPNGQIQFFKNSQLKQINKGNNNSKGLYSGTKQMSYPKNYKGY